MAARRARLLPWIAAERAVRGLLLVGVGIYLLFQPNANLGSLATRLARRVDFDPDHGFVHHVIIRIGALDHNQITLIGAGAVAYGSARTGRGRRPLASQTLGRVANRDRNIAARTVRDLRLIHRPSLLKAAGLTVNILIVIYLVRVVRRHER